MRYILGIAIVWGIRVIGFMIRVVGFRKEEVRGHEPF